MSSIDSRLAPTFAAQLGLITRQQVLAAGGRQSTIDYRVANGRWTMEERGVYALAGIAWTWRRHLAAVVLSLPTAYASHRAAAKLLGVGDFHRPPIELTVPDGNLSRRARRAFPERAEAAGVPVIIHQAEDFAMEVPRLIDGIPTSPPQRLATDIGNLVSFDRYRKIIGDIQRRHGLTWLDLDRVWRKHSRRGRNGCGALHELLDLHFGAAGAPTEVVEARCAMLLTQEGLPEPEHQFAVRRPDGMEAILDLAYPALRIGIETEGRIHDWSEVRQSDHTRRNNLQLLGWIIFHFTWEDVTRRPTYVVNVVRNAVNDRLPPK